MSRNHRVMVVEDNPSDARLVREAFRDVQPNVQLSFAKDGVAALDVLRQSNLQPDLILLDLKMPRMTGREFLEVVKAEPALRRIPVVVLTSSDAPDDVDKAYRAGCNGYVTKPVDLDGLMGKLTAIVAFWLENVRRAPAARRATSA